MGPVTNHQVGFLGAGAIAEVFTWDQGTGRPVVANPYNCVVACSNCKTICPSGSIGFPTIEWLGEFLETLREGACGCS